MYVNGTWENGSISQLIYEQAVTHCKICEWSGTGNGMGKGFFRLGSFCSGRFTFGLAVFRAVAGAGQDITDLLFVADDAFRRDHAFFVDEKGEGRGEGLVLARQVQ